MVDSILLDWSLTVPVVVENTSAIISIVAGVVSVDAGLLVSIGHVVTHQGERTSVLVRLSVHVHSWDSHGALAVVVVVGGVGVVVVVVVVAGSGVSSTGGAWGISLEVGSAHWEDDQEDDQQRFEH